MDNCPSRTETPHIAETDSSTRDMLRARGRLAFMAGTITTLLGTIYGVGDELINNDAAFDAANLPARVESGLTGLLGNRSCDAYPETSAINALLDRSQQAEQEFDNPIKIAEHFELEIAPFDTYIASRDAIFQATNIQAATDHLGQFTKAYHGVELELYLQNPPTIDLAEHKTGLQNSLDILHLLPRELFADTGINSIVITDREMDAISNDRSAQAAGTYDPAIGQVLVHTDFIDSSRVLIHEIFHAVQSDSCGGSIFVTDTALGDLNPADYQYAGGDYLDVEVDRHSHVSRYSNKNPSEDFADSGHNMVLRHGLPDSALDMSPRQSKQVLAAHRLDQVTKPGMTAYLTSLVDHGWIKSS